MKFLIVEMSDGTRWAIPAMAIAKDRAAYLAKRDAESGLGDYDHIYEEEIVWAMSDDYEIRDWASNNMNWEDVSSWATQLKSVPPKVDYHKDWVNAPKSLQEMEL